MGWSRERFRDATPPRAVQAALAAAAALVALALVASPPAGAQEPSEDRLLAEGGLVYEANCSACHGADGLGVTGVFPPLDGNPNVQDAEYVRGVIRNGRTGEIVVDGVTYNGAMPAFAGLSDEEVDAVIAFVQRGFGVPTDGGAEPTPAPEEPSAGLPVLAVISMGLAFVVFAVGVAAVLLPIVIVRNREKTFTTTQSSLKTAVIVLYLIAATVVVPSYVLQSDLLAEPPSVYLDLFSDELWGTVRDLIGAGVWLVALGLGLWALRRAQRDDVI